ncbi:hypothetical protein RM543_17780 [Roseicyclus sp. F158]|uniref:Asparagine synthase n=1 Tax=Tropicimonas omnivorans TaxID=3075590 RepID=A0ABU3DLD6_9RHOB|nr:hypothetical protein [Roseicyclus sp. F158]MDT0684526.1 hypothetical protein [Roseicyclus sp. F158]
MTSMKPHRRQFIVTVSERPEALASLPGFRTRPLAEDVFLHHDPELLITEEPDRLILGRMLREGDGRYVTIRDGWLSLDASGSLGVQYFREGDVICASSPVLLSRFTQRNLRVPRSDIRFSWIASPFGPVEGSRRLFCDQSLELATRQTRVLSRDRVGPRALDEAAAFVAAEFVEIARALGQTGHPLFVALTGGQDSRTIFSALVAAGVPFRAFTLRLSDGASHKDIRVANAICKACGIEHVVVGAERGGADSRLAAYLEHSRGIDGDRGREYAAGNYYRQLPDGALVLHGGSLGLSKLPYDEFLADLPDRSKTSVIGVFDRIFGPVPPDDAKALSQWYDYRERYAFSDLGDYFFLDQRRAAWGGDNRFAEDVFGFEWVLFANSWPLIDAF